MGFEQHGLANLGNREDCEVGDRKGEAQVCKIILTRWPHCQTGGRQLGEHLRTSLWATLEAWEAEPRQDEFMF